MNVIWETQKAVYAALVADSMLMSLVEGVFDHVPEGSKYPYVTIGNISCSQANGMEKKAWALSLGVNVLSRNKGRREVHEIMERLRELLENQPLELEDYEHVATSFGRSETRVLSDGQIVGAGMEFIIRIREL